MLIIYLWGKIVAPSVHALNVDLHGKGVAPLKLTAFRVKEEREPWAGNLAAPLNSEFVSHLKG